MVFYDVTNCDATNYDVTKISVYMFYLLVTEWKQIIYDGIYKKK